MIAVWLAKSLAFVLLDVFTLLCLVSSILIPSVTSLYISLIFTSVVFFFFLLFFSFYAYSSASFLWFLSSNSLSIRLLLLLFHPHCVSLFFCFCFFFLTGDIFLLNTSRLPDRCEFSLHSPILPGSVDSCLLELAIYSQDAVPLLQRFTAEIRYVDTNRNIIISLRVGHEEDAG